MTIYLTDLKTGQKILVNAASHWECAAPVQSGYAGIPILGQTPPPPIVTNVTFSSGKLLTVVETPEEIKALIDAVNQQTK